MTVYNVIILGDGPVGKTSLVCSLKGWRHNQDYMASIGSDFNTVNLNGDINLRVWDTSGAERFRSTRFEYIAGTNFALYCVDLATEINTETIRQDIRDIRARVDGIRVILVATKCDAHREIAEQRIAQMSREVGSDTHIVTSAQNGDVKTHVEQAIVDLTLPRASAAVEEQEVEEQEPEVAVSLIPENIRQKLLRSLYNGHATVKQRQQIRAALDQLDGRVAQNNTQIPEATEDFVTQCHTILEGRHPNIMAAVYALAGAVVVAGIIALAGIGFGIAVLPLSITSCIWGAATSTLIANSMFKERKYVDDVLSNYSTEVSTHLGIVTRA